MRYKEGEIPPELLAENASNHMLVFTAEISLLIAIVLIWFGIRGKQIWMWSWGAGLVICSIYLWFAIKYDFRPFGYF